MTYPVFSPSTIFCPGEPPLINYPLARYLPPYYSNSITQIIENNPSLRGLSPESAIILDPFGASPLTAVEIARNGFPIVVCSNNPINRLLIELVAQPPTKEELLPILAEIAGLKKGANRLEVFIRSLYQSTCNSCGSDIEVEAYIWEKTANDLSHHLILKKYQCQVCGRFGEYPISKEDLNILEKIPSLDIFEYEAANKVVSRNDSQWQVVIDAVRLHPPRALYALFTILNKIENLTLPDRKRKLVLALLLGIIDQANGLWPNPPRRHRPKQLVLSSQFIEHNLWLMLERAVEYWNGLREPQSSISVVHLPQLPRAGEIGIFDGRIKDLINNYPDLEFPFILTVLPRPNQAYWTLSAIWTGWLLGKSAVTPFKSVLQRKRYDWGWHCHALFSAFSDIITNKRYPIQFTALIEENEPNFLAASLIAGDRAGLELTGFAYQMDEHRVQIGWKFPYSRKSQQIYQAAIGEKEAIFQQQIERILISKIQMDNEPLPYARAHAVAMTNVVHFSQFDGDQSANPLTINEIYEFDQISDFPNTFLNLLQQVILNSKLLRVIPEDHKSIEFKYVWLKSAVPSNISLSDQIEQAIYEILQERRCLIYKDLLQSVYRKFYGFSTPDREYINICLSSYANPIADTEFWELRLEDHSTNRQRDLKEMLTLLYRLAERLNILMIESPNLSWLNARGEIIAEWIIRPTGLISDILRKANSANLYLLTPGSRVNLILYKIHHNPLFSDYFPKQLKIVRFRQIRWLIDQPDLDITHFERLLTLDPIKYETPQLSFW